MRYTSTPEHGILATVKLDDGLEVETEFVLVVFRRSFDRSGKLRRISGDPIRNTMLGHLCF